MPVLGGTITPVELRAHYNLSFCTMNTPAEQAKLRGALDRVLWNHLPNELYVKRSADAQRALVLDVTELVLLIAANDWRGVEEMRLRSVKPSKVHKFAEKS